MAARSSHASPAISPDKRLGLNPNWVHFPGAPSGSENGGKGLNRNENNVIEPERLTIFDRLGEVRPPLKLSQRMAPASPAPYSPPPPSSPSTPDSMRTKTQKTMFVQQPIRSSERLRKSASAASSPTPIAKRTKSLASRIGDNITIDLTRTSSPRNKGGRSSRLSSATSSSGSEDDVEEILLGTSRLPLGTLDDPIVLADSQDDGYGAPSSPPKRRSPRHLPLSARIEAPSLRRDTGVSGRTKSTSAKSSPSHSTVPLAKRVGPRRTGKRKTGIDDGASVQGTLSSRMSPVSHPSPYTIPSSTPSRRSTPVSPSPVRHKLRSPAAPKTPLPKSSTISQRSRSPSPIDDELSILDASSTTLFPSTQSTLAEDSDTAIVSPSTSTETVQFGEHTVQKAKLRLEDEDHTMQVDEVTAHDQSLSENAVEPGAPEPRPSNTLSTSAPVSRQPSPLPPSPNSFPALTLPSSTATSPEPESEAHPERHESSGPRPENDDVMEIDTPTTQTLESDGSQDKAENLLALLIDERHKDQEPKESSPLCEVSQPLKSPARVPVTPVEAIKKTTIVAQPSGEDEVATIATATSSITDLSGTKQDMPVYNPPESLKDLATLPLVQTENSSHSTDSTLVSSRGASPRPLRSPSRPSPPEQSNSETKSDQRPIEPISSPRPFTLKRSSDMWHDEDFDLMVDSPAEVSAPLPVIPNEDTYNNNGCSYLSHHHSNDAASFDRSRQEELSRADKPTTPPVVVKVCAVLQAEGKKLKKVEYEVDDEIYVCARRWANRYVHFDPTKECIVFRYHQMTPAAWKKWSEGGLTLDSLPSATQGYIPSRNWFAANVPAVHNPQWHRPRTWVGFNRITTDMTESVFPGPNVFDIQPTNPDLADSIFVIAYSRPTPEELKKLLYELDQRNPEKVEKEMTERFAKMTAAACDRIRLRGSGVNFGQYAPIYPPN